MIVTILLRHGFAAEWTLANSLLQNGEPGYETDTGLFKIGDGIRRWKQLPYANSSDAQAAVGAVVDSLNDLAEVVDSNNVAITTDLGNYKIDTDDRFDAISIFQTTTENELISLDQAKQNADPSLDQIAALSPTDDDVLQRKAGGWVSRTIAQLKTDLALTRSDVGLGNVNNTADTDKPISNDTAAALGALSSAVSGKEPSISPGDSTQYYRGDKSWQVLNKTAVGLTNVDNTADANKPISTNQQAALDDRVRHDTSSQGLSTTRQSNARTNISAVARNELVFNVKDYGAKGDNSTVDDTAIAAAITAAKAAGVFTRGATLFFPSGAYLITTPIVLPRTGSTPINVVKVCGASVRSTSIVSNTSFPTNRGMIEWEATTSRAWHQEITDLTITLPSVTGVRAIWYKKNTAGTTLTDFNNERMQITLRDLLLEGNNGYHTSLVKLEGQVFYSQMTRVRGDNARSSLLGATVYSPVTDVDTITFEFDSNLYSQPLSSDILGFSYGAIENCSAGSLRRGGSGVLVKGKLKNSTVNNNWCDGGRYDAGVDLINSFNVNVINTGNEGKSATQVRIKDSQNITLGQFSPSAQDPEFPDWTASTAYTTAWGVVVPGWRSSSTGAVPANNNWYLCTVAGTSGSSQPTWPTTPGATVTDGGVTWQCVGPAVNDAIVIDGGRSNTLDRVATGPGLPNFSARGCKMLSTPNSPIDLNANGCVAPDNPLNEVSWTAASGRGDFLGARNGERVRFGSDSYGPNRTDLPILATDAKYGLSGTTDNTTAMQAAVDAAAASGQNVHFPMRPLGQPYMLGGTGHLLKIPAGLKRISADRGVVFKVKNSNGNYKSMLGGTLSSTDLSGLTIEDLIFDQNSGGNVVSDVATLLVEGTQRFCLFAGAGSDITVYRCKFQNIDGLNTLYLGSATMKDVRIESCDFSLVGTSSAYHDHSTIYTSCDGTTIVNNTFRGVLGGLGATTAIETHGPNQEVSGNRIDGYRIGANITGITNLGNDGINFIKNVIRNALIGVQLWSWTGTNGGLVDVDVSYNRIHLNRDPWYLTSTDHPRGICMNQAASGSGAVTHIDGLTLSFNRIRFASFTTSLTNDYLNASGIELVSQDTSVEIRDFFVCDNKVFNAIGPALRVGCILRRGEIHDNHWVNPSSTSQTLGTPAGFTTFWRSAVCFTGNANLFDVKMFSNRTFDTRGTHLLSQAWATSLSGSNTATRCEEGDNTIVCDDGVILPENSQTTNKKFAARGISTGPRYKTGILQTAQGGIPSSSNLTLIDTQEYCIPFPVPSSQTFIEMNCNVVTVGSVGGTVLRYGVRLDDGTGGPGTLLFDAGTVAADTGAGVGAKPKTIAQTLPPGWVWLTITAQGSNVVISGMTGWLIGSSGSTSIAAAIQARSTYYQTGVTGALPSTFTSGGQSAINPAIFIKP